jgi:hypothetical protein
MEQMNAVLVGGPADQTVLALPEDTTVREVHHNGTIHRYFRTTSRRSVEGQDLVVFTYDGQVYEGRVSPQPT